MRIARNSELHMSCGMPRRGITRLQQAATGALIPFVFLALSLCGCAPSSGRATRSPAGDPATWQAALPELERRAQERPGDSDLLGRLAAAYYFSDRFQEAESLSIQAIEIEPRQGTALYVRALLLERADDWEGADEIYRRRDELKSMSRQLKEIMRSRHAIVSREILRRQVRAELEGIAQSPGPIIKPNAMVVRRFQPLGVSRSDSILAVGITHFLTTAFAQIGNLIVIDNTRRFLLEEEIALSADESFAASSRLAASAVGAGLSVAGRVGGKDAEPAEALIQYTVDDLVLSPDNPVYRGTPNLVELSSPTRYLLQDLGGEVVRVAEENLHITLDPDTRARLARPPTKNFKAFMAFAEGLFWEQEDRFRQANECFHEAGRLDPGFDWAHDGVDRVSGGGEHGEALPPDTEPAEAPGEEFERRAGDVAVSEVDEMPGRRSEKPQGMQPPPAPQDGQVRIIVRPQP